MKQIDYTGFKTKAFTVIKRSDASKWLVRCNKCGQEHIRTISNIKRRKTTGCEKCTHRIAIAKPNDWHLYVHYKGHARDKNRVFELTYEQFKEIVQKDCFYCGSSPKVMQHMLRYCKNSEPQPLNGIDRIDSSKGYTVDNCVSCCPLCNQMKSNIDQNVFLAQIEKIYNFKNVQRLSREGVESSDSK